MRKLARLICVSLIILLCIILGIGSIYAQEDPGRPPITVENAGQLAWLAAFGDGDMEGLAFSPDGKYLVGSIMDGPIQVWEIATGEESMTLDVDTSSASLAFNPDGSLLASGIDNSVQVWDMATGTELQVLDSPPLAVSESQSGYVCDIDFSPDGSLLAAVACETGSNVAFEVARVWDTTSWEIVATLEGNLELEFNPDGALFTSDGARILRWDLAAGTDGVEVATSEAGIVTFAVSSNGTGFALSDYNNYLAVTNTGTDLWAKEAHENFVAHIAFTSDATVVVSQEFSLFFDPSQGLMSMTWLPADKLVTLWNAETGDELVTLAIEPGLVVRGMKLSLDGSLLAFATTEGVQLWGIPD